jgi:hypothetical protein
MLLQLQPHNLQHVDLTGCVCEGVSCHEGRTLSILASCGRCSCLWGL